MKLFFSILLSFLIFNQSLIAEDKPTFIRSKPFSEIKYYPIKTAPAQVFALTTASLSSELTSIVDNINVLAGTKVSKGDILVQLNCDDFQYQLSDLIALKTESEASLLLGKYQLARASKLYKTKNLSEFELKKEQANVNIQKARLQSVISKIALAEKNVLRCDIRAPFSGVIVERLVNVGEMVSHGQKILSLSDPSQSEILAQLDIALIDNININESFFVFQHKKYPLTLRAVIPVIEGRARHQQYRFTFTNNINKPLLNAFGELQISLSEPHLAPDLIVKRQDKSGIFIVKNKTAVFLPVDNVQFGRPFTLKLNDSSNVVIEGQHSLEDGQKIQQLESDSF